MSADEAIRERIDALIASDRAVLFMKGTREQPQCGFSATTVGILDSLLADYVTVNVLEDPAIRDGIKAYSDWPTIPQLYIDKEFTGGRKVIDVSGDGDDNQGIAGLRAVRDMLVAKGVVINGLPIIVKPPEYIFPPQPPEGLDVYYRNHVVGGEGHVTIESIGFDNFKQAILQKLLLEIG